MILSRNLFATHFSPKHSRVILASLRYYSDKAGKDLEDWRQGWAPADSSFATAAIHGGYDPKADTFGQVVPPISLATINVQDTPDVVTRGYFYSRCGNPSREALQKTFAVLDKAEYGFAFSAGVSAIASVLSTLKSGDEVLSFDDIFLGSGLVLQKFQDSFGIKTNFADFREGSITSVKDVLSPKTKMIWIESPTNPTLKIIDIAQVVKAAREYSKDIIVAVDNTFLTSFYQRPLELGADLSVYSVTKYMNGHSDVLMGAVTTNREDLAQKIQANQIQLGLVPSPFDCYLALRGLKTLHVRMPLHMENGMRVAQFLEAHSRVESVLHPGLSSHPDHLLAKKQASGHSGLLAFYLKDATAKDFLQKLKIFQKMVSLGAPESLASAPSLQTHAGLPADLKERLHITDNLIRLSVGLESVEDLLQDLDQALNSI